MSRSVREEERVRASQAGQTDRSSGRDAAQRDAYSGRDAAPERKWTSAEIETPTGEEVQLKSRSEMLARNREERLKKLAAEERSTMERTARTAIYIGLVVTLAFVAVELIFTAKIAIGPIAVFLAMTGSLMHLPRKTNRFERVMGTLMQIISVVLLFLRLYMELR